MKRILTIFMAITLFFSAMNFIEAEDFSNYKNSIRIKIASYSQDGYELKSSGGFNIIDSGNIIANTKKDAVKLFFNGSEMGIYDNGGLIGKYDFSREIVISPVIGELNFKDNIYTGDFTITKLDGSLVNIVEMEDYVNSVVANEVGNTFEIEAIKAQAVAARTYAFYNGKKYIDKGYNLTGDAYSQIYNGKKRVDDKIRNAVAETKGEVITYNGGLIDATYSSSNGGIIASAKEVWGEERPYLISKLDPYSINTPKVNWSYSTSLKEIETKINPETKLLGLESISIIRSDEGRVSFVVCKYPNEEKKIRAERFRSLMGNANIKSTNFTIEEALSINKPENKIVISKYGTIDLFAEEAPSTELVSTNNITINGKGTGHGVGMSQYGANEMAKQKFNYKDIIKFYYNGVEINKIYE
ncbi:MAG: SpoIID/LytB domain-containing protein [Firmicutes bacterium]|nr:SpoIID/LytB domain-containing protein [Bacillota bacterium]